MNKSQMREAILAAKQSKGMSWEAIGEATGMSPVFICSACLGENSLLADQAEKLCGVLGLPGEVGAALQVYPEKGQRYQEMLSDPLVYRLNEVVMVYGETLKEVIQEKFGDGIMSAIDFTMEVDKVEDPKGDRVVLTLNGKFLPYKRW
ncbi:cyanate lyase [Alkalispirillum mobile]|uniref:Cyanate hydratase n=1 Tax=Alkalispirillum mobile TaxID=85925 RepID=A0A498C7F3_9GAMM|nr:cyanase [Alkalispirillum mobile]RLK48161.1 cyanate lyase [Alkalispirillum mobile]